MFISIGITCKVFVWDMSTNFDLDWPFFIILQFLSLPARALSLYREISLILHQLLNAPGFVKIYVLCWATFDKDRGIPLLSVELVSLQFIIDLILSAGATKGSIDYLLCWVFLISFAFLLSLTPPIPVDDPFFENSFSYVELTVILFADFPCYE